MASITKRSVTVNGIMIIYSLERKAVKNINLRVRADGSVYVSAPRFAAVSLIDGFVQEKADFIHRAQARMAVKREAEQKQRSMQYKNGDCVYILGHALPIEVIRGSRNSIVYAAEAIRMQVVSLDDVALRQKLVDKLLDKLCQQLFQEVLLEQYALVKPFGAPFPALRMRNMKSRWGSCLVQKQIITMNKKLIHMPRACVEQVMLHELCHFFEANHSPRFYAWLDKLMPDWRERRQLLRDLSAKII